MWYPAPTIKCGKAKRNLFKVKLGERGPLTIIDYSGQGCLPRTLAVLTFLLGLTYLVLTPPFQVPDEPNHFLRSFQVSQGVILGVKQHNQAGGFLPRTVIQEVAFFSHLAFKPEKQTSSGEWRQNLRESRPLSPGHLSEPAFGHFPNTIMYSPIPYLPQALGFALAKGLALKGLEALYLSRFLALLASVALLAASFSLLAFAVRLRLTIFLLATMPMSIFLLASISADGLTISLALVTAALCIRLTRQWSDRLFIWLLVTAVLLSLCKTCYLLIPLGGLPAVWQAPLRSHLKWGAAAALVAMAFLPALAWTALTTSLFVPLRPDHLVNPQLQLRFVLEQPLTVMWAFGSSPYPGFSGNPAVFCRNPRLVGHLFTLSGLPFTPCSWGSRCSPRNLPGTGR